tara:strand:- start:7289 stop:7432 length:144 start_codon:yes stop_codon:yes gene_type:complete
MIEDAIQVRNNLQLTYTGRVVLFPWVKQLLNSLKYGSAEDTETQWPL